MKLVELSRSRLLALAAGCVLALGLWCARSPAVPVQVAAAQRAPLRVEVNTNGAIEPLPEAELRLHARLEGRIVHIPEPGTRVEAGALLLEIDAGPAAAALAEAESERLAAEEALRTARQARDLAERRAATDAELFRAGALTAERHAEGRAALREARQSLANLEQEVPLRVAALDHRIEELRAQREAGRTAAPFAGTVYRTAHRAGELVRAGEPVLWLADLSRLRVRANVDQVDLGRVAVGQSVRITSNAYPEREWSAVVSEIVPHVVVKENRSVAEGIARVEPPTQGLLPGMTVDVDVVVDDVADALQVPAAAVFSADGRPFVYRVAGSRARRTPVRLGRASVRAIEIVEGLDANDRVVVWSPNGLEDGTRVEAELEDVAAR